MDNFSPAERAFAAAIANISYCNPFLPERMAFEKEALGDDFVERSPVLSKQDEFDDRHPNLERATARSHEILERVRERFVSRTQRAGDAERDHYRNLVNFLLYHRFRAEFDELIESASRGAAKPVEFYERFEAEYSGFLPGDSDEACARLFALCFQLRRAYHQIFYSIIGGSMPAAKLRASVWQSIFTHDMRRYQRALHHRMGDFTCLITGASGTGKELVARAIGLSRFIPFNPETRRFAEDFGKIFLPLNMSALTPTLIESELFGHKRGAFTGALADRIGWFETCSPLGTIFLDEIGEIDLTLQVKLLRVLQTRTFQRIGETQERRFQGKIMAATNRDLPALMRGQRFREDLYYRLCGDRIVTPTLREQLIDSPEELSILMLHIARGLVGEIEAPGLVADGSLWIDAHLGPDYPWPGNVRELEQCMRNILVRNDYLTPSAAVVAASSDAREALGDSVSRGAMTAEELLTHYTSMLYAETGSYQETARRLDLDHRTIKKRIQPELLVKYGGRANMVEAPSPS